jgi:hypothetical protein
MFASNGDVSHPVKYRNQSQKIYGVGIEPGQRFISSHNGMQQVSTSVEVLKNGLRRQTWV